MEQSPPAASAAVHHILNLIQRLPPPQIRLLGEHLIVHSGPEASERGPNALEFFMAYLQHLLMEERDSHLRRGLDLLLCQDRSLIADLVDYCQRQARLLRQDADEMAQLRATRQPKRGPDPAVAAETAAIVAMKDKQGLSWRALQKEMAAQFGVRRSIDALRQRYYRARRPNQPPDGRRANQPGAVP